MTSDRVRRTILAIASVTVLCAAFELAAERHWGTAVKLIPWYAVAALVFCIGTLAVRPTKIGIRIVRVVLVGVAITSIVGIYEHVHENFIAGPLDYRYTDRWPAMSLWSQWWAAFVKTVGPAPTLAPGVLLLAAVLVHVATGLYESRPRPYQSSLPASPGSAKK